MAVTEEVVVKLKVEPSGFDKTIEVLDKSTKAFSATEKSVSALDRALKAIGEVLKTGGIVMNGFKDFIKMLVETADWLWENVEGLTALSTATTTTSVVQKTSARWLIGVYVPVLGQILLAIQAIRLGYKVWNDALERNMEVQENNQRITKATDILYKAFLDKAIVPLTGAWNNFTTAIKEGLLTMSAWGSAGTAALALASVQVSAVEELNELILAQVDGTNDLNQAVININSQLQDQNLTTEERIDLLGQLRDAEIAILKAEREVQEQRVAVAGLALINDLTPEEEAAATLKLAQEKQKLGAIDQQIAQQTISTFHQIAQLQEDDKKNKEEDIVLTQNLADLEIERAKNAEMAQEAVNEMNEEADEWLEIWNTNYEETQPILRDLAIDFGEMSDEIIEDYDKMDKAAEQEARNRIAWAEFGAEGQLRATSSILGSLSELSDENLQLQKAFAIAQVIVDSSVASIQAWRNPLPVALALQGVIVAQTAASIQAINAVEAGQTGTVLNPVVTTPSTQSQRQPIDTASGNFFSRNTVAPPQAQTVLVTEDLTAVQTRVAVTESRASIGSSDSRRP
jgi:hypothetical protein